MAAYRHRMFAEKQHTVHRGLTQKERPHLPQNEVRDCNGCDKNGWGERGAEANTMRNHGIRVYGWY